MASLMEDLIIILNTENSEYKILLELSIRKTPIIVQGDLKELQQITEEEQSVVGRIAQLEQKRETAINDIANVINKDVKDLKLVTLIQMLENRPTEQKKLAVIHDGLQETMRQMVHVNEQNKELLASAMELLEYDLNYFQALNSAPETANYNKGACNAGELMGNSPGRFDAKQ